MPTTLEVYSRDRCQPAQYPEDARKTAGKLGNSLTLAAGTVLGKRTSDSKLYAYNDALTDGTNVAVGILEYATKTDSSGNAFFGDSTTASSLNVPHQTVPYWVSGTFDTADLTGYDAAALADLNGRVLANAFIKIN